MAHSELSSRSPGHSSINNNRAIDPTRSDYPDSSAVTESSVNNNTSNNGQTTRNVTTPAMLTLGRDGSDFVETGIGTNTPSPSNRDAVETDIDTGIDTDQRPWWDRVTNALHITTSQEQAANVDSDSLQSPAAVVARYRSNSGSGGASETTSTAVYTSLENDATETAANHEHNGRDGFATMPVEEETRERTKRTNKAEDLLQQDCSFFYQGMESPPVSNGGGRRGLQRLRALVRPRQPAHQQQSQLFEYRDSVDVLAPPVLAHYRARYQQLNQILRTDSDEDLAASSSMHHHDLELMADGDGISLTRHTNTNGSNSNAMMAQTVENSSLFYMLHGRMLMRLPRDQVRLVMDNDLEAGILSVEQWRPEDCLLSEQDINAAAAAAAAAANDTLDGSTGNSSHHGVRVPAAAVPFQDRPPLRYVLTVHDDLYRRIVAEMSEGLYKPYWGLSGCLNENERVDIRVAIAVMAVIMFVLLINTFIWPVE